jgi:hypothetical protein
MPILQFCNGCSTVLVAKTIVFKMLLHSSMQKQIIISLGDRFRIVGSFLRWKTYTIGGMYATMRRQITKMERGKTVSGVNNTVYVEGDSPARICLQC